jgi:alkanesulfonate monooxygenase SsuD/methylene tetrahydromethanopterin reductase-like flavin-dependent oxidoreductase (luciferase family)
LKLDLGISSSSSLSAAIQFSKLAERGRLNCIWIREALNAQREIFTIASIILLETSRAKVGIGVTSPLDRNISTIARAAATLSQMGRGRFILGLDAARPSALMRDAATLLRRIWRGETVTFTSDRFRLSNYYARYKADFATPIYFGVRNPKLLALAGETADGVILSGPKKYIEKAVAVVDQGLRRRRRRGKSFCFVAWVPTVIVDKKSNLKLAREAVATVLAGTPKVVLEMADIAQERVKPIKAMMAEKGVKGACRIVAEELLQEVAVYGSPEEVALDLRSLEKYRIDEAIFGPPYGRAPAEAIGKMVQAWKKLK